MNHIDPQALKAQRERLELSLAELASKAKIDKQTIWRLEHGLSGKVRAETVKRLCLALAVQPEVLAARPEGEDESQSSTLPLAESRLNIRLGHNVRNALSLAAQRYGVNASQILEIAPLLFVIAAERSLSRRTQIIDKVTEASEKIDIARQLLPHLEGLWRNERIDDAIRCETDAIRKRDLFANQIDDDQLAFGYDKETDDPFDSYLRAETKAIDGIESFEWFDGPSYEICREQALATVGGCEAAAQSIVVGHAPLHEIPKDIRGVGFESARADWVNQYAADYNARFSAAFLSDLGLNAEL